MTRAEIAEKFLAMALCGESYTDTAVWLRKVDYLWCWWQRTINTSVLTEMASVLEQAAKEEVSR